MAWTCDRRDPESMKTKRILSIIGSTLLVLSPTNWAVAHSGGGGGGFGGGGFGGGGWPRRWWRRSLRRWRARRRRWWWFPRRWRLPSRWVPWWRTSHTWSWQPRRWCRLWRNAHAKWCSEL